MRILIFWIIQILFPFPPFLSFFFLCFCCCCCYRGCFRKTQQKFLFLSSLLSTSILIFSLFTRISFSFFFFVLFDYLFTHVCMHFIIYLFALFIDLFALFYFLFFTFNETTTQPRSFRSGNILK